MTDQALELPRRESRLLRWLKGIALLRESVVGMIGAGIIVFWLLIALFADILAPFPPNATLAPLQMPGADFLVSQGAQVLGQPAEEACSHSANRG